MSRHVVNQKFDFHADDQAESIYCFRKNRNHKMMNRSHRHKTILNSRRHKTMNRSRRHNTMNRSRNCCHEGEERELQRCERECVLHRNHCWQKSNHIGYSQRF